MRLDGNDVLMMMGLGEDVVMPFVSYAGKPTLQPGTAIGGYGIGDTLRNKKFLDFRTKSVSGGAGYECEQNYSVARVDRSRRVVKQDSSVWTYGLDDAIRQQYPNTGGGELWLFPKSIPSASAFENVGYGVKPMVSPGSSGFITLQESGLSEMAPGLGAILTCRAMEVTAVIYSTDLFTAHALSDNLLWDWDTGDVSKNVSVAYFDGVVSGDDSIWKPLVLKKYYSGQVSSNRWWELAILNASVFFGADSSIAVSLPIFRFLDGSSMFGTTYGTSSNLKVLYYVQFSSNR